MCARVGEGERESKRECRCVREQEHIRKREIVSVLPGVCMRERESERHRQRNRETERKCVCVEREEG